MSGWKAQWRAAPGHSGGDSAGPQSSGRAGSAHFADDPSPNYFILQSLKTKSEKVLGKLYMLQHSPYSQVSNSLCMHIGHTASNQLPHLEQEPFLRCQPTPSPVAGASALQSVACDARLWLRASPQA